MDQHSFLQKMRITLTCMLLSLFILFLWIPSIALAATGTTSARLSSTATVQETPVVDATTTALQKEQLAEQVEQLHHQNNWIWSFGSTILSTIAVAIAGLFGLFRYLRDQRAEREKQREMEQQRLVDRQDERRKRSEERFQQVIEGLGSTSEATQVGAAIMLRTFLRPGYEHVYSQVFDLAVAHLRLRNTPSHTPTQPTSLSQALILVFREAFPLIRNLSHPNPQLLDAARIQLDYAHLSGADLRLAWLSEASLHHAALKRTDLSEANLYKSNLMQADLRCANLTKTNLYKANLERARMNDAELSQADLRGANLEGADLQGAILTGADLSFAQLENTHLETTQSLSGTNLYKATGLSQAQLQICLKKGAILEKASPPTPDLPRTTVFTPQHTSFVSETGQVSQSGASPQR